MGLGVGLPPVAPASPTFTAIQSIFLIWIISLGCLSSSIGAGLNDASALIAPIDVGVHLASEKYNGFEDTAAKRKADTNLHVVQYVVHGDVCMSKAFGAAGPKLQNCCQGTTGIMTQMHEPSARGDGAEWRLGTNRSPRPPLAPTRASKSPPTAPARPKSLQRLDESSDCASEDTCSVYSTFDSDDFVFEPSASFCTYSEYACLL